MIAIIGLFGLAAFVLASAVVGIRILLLAARTRLLPETAIGASLLLAGGIGAALMIVPLFLPDLAPRTDYVVYQLASGIAHVGYALLYVFVWRVFRREEGWATALFVFCTGTLFVGAAGMAWSLEPGGVLMGRSAETDVWFWMSLGSRFVGYGWATIESFRYHGMLRRRLRLGLADEEVVARFFYWGVCMAAVLLIWVNTAVQALRSEMDRSPGLSEIVTAVLGFAVAGSLWFAFFPSKSREPAEDPGLVAKAGQGS